MNSSVASALSKVPDDSLRSQINGFPSPEKYDVYYINQYSFPKGLKSVPKRPKRNDETNRSITLDEIETPVNRRGVHGWKLSVYSPPTDVNSLVQSAFGTNRSKGKSRGARGSVESGLPTLSSTSRGGPNISNH